MQEYNNL